MSHKTKTEGTNRDEYKEWSPVFLSMYEYVCVCVCIIFRCLFYLFPVSSFSGH